MATRVLHVPSPWGPIGVVNLVDTSGVFVVLGGDQERGFAFACQGMEEGWRSAFSLAFGVDGSQVSFKVLSRGGPVDSVPRLTDWVYVTKAGHLPFGTMNQSGGGDRQHRVELVEV